MESPAWVDSPPRIYDVVTGFFPETSPKGTWATNPRPLLVCGTAQDPDSKTYFCRVAYGTSQSAKRFYEKDLVIGNMSLLDSLGLKHVTRFVLNSGLQMVIMPWTEKFSAHGPVIKRPL